MKSFLTIFSVTAALVLLSQIPLPNAEFSTYFQPAAIAPNEIESLAPKFPEIDIIAKGAIVVSYPSGERIFEKNADEIFALASLAKLMTALVVEEIISERVMTFPVRISEEDVLVEGDSGLLVGEEFLSSELLNLMLVGSSNDAAQALARSSRDYSTSVQESSFIDLMNDRAKELGLGSMFFLSEHGLDISGNRSSAFGSAADVAKLLSVILRDFYEMLAPTRHPEIQVESVLGRKITVRNSNILASSLPVLVASKTGYTDIAGGNLAIAADVGFQNPVIIVILGSTSVGRFQDALKLYEAAMIYYSS